jgi:hypothetical protein
MLLWAKKCFWGSKNMFWLYNILSQRIFSVKRKYLGLKIYFCKIFWDNNFTPPPRTPPSSATKCHHELQ